MMEMDHRDVQQVLSALTDGEQVDPAEEEAALAHLETCPECRAFRAGIIAISAAGSAAAPEGLAAAILDRTAKTPASGIAAMPGPVPATTAPVATRPVALPDWLSRRRLWVLTGVTASAALLIGGFVLLGTGIMGAETAAETSVDAAVRQALTRKGAPAAAPQVGATAASDAEAAAAAAAPNYVVYGADRVYVDAGSFGASDSVLATSGTVRSALGSGGMAGQVTVLALSAPASSAIVLAYPDGRRERFVPVVRVYDGRTFALVTGRAIERFGQWPTLAGRFPAPATPDGSPVFQRIGVDDRGVAVYVPPAGRASDGIAIAPGTASSDPAGGNPNWTWWIPL